MAKKTVPRAVLEAQLSAIEAARRRRRIAMVAIGVYVALFVGVLGSQAIALSDDLTVAAKPLEIGQLGGASIIATILYNRREQGRKNAKLTPGSVARMMLSALEQGFFWMTVIGAWW